MKRIVFKYSCYFLIFIFFTGCTAVNQRNYQSLRGNWQSVLRSDALYFAGENYYFNFHDDSFKVKIKSWSDVIDYQPWNPCSKLNNVEFASGTFSIDNDKIFFNGMFTDSMYNIIKKGCFRVGKYESSYDCSFHGDSIYLVKYNKNNQYDKSEIFLKRGKN